VDVVLGTGVLTLRECLVLQRDHIVKLAEPAGGDLQIRVQGITMATGEVVVVDDAAALRVTHILPPAGVEAA
jgi:flagellar motor switch/type III secretory pathway protein FliN